MDNPLQEKIVSIATSFWGDRDWKQFHTGKNLAMNKALIATGTGNLLIVFGEPILDLATTEDDPRTGKVRSDDVDGIACWFIDTNYNGEAFFVRYAYFLGANYPYKGRNCDLAVACCRKDDGRD
jgi:hypothetical protein